MITDNIEGKTSVAPAGENNEHKEATAFMPKDEQKLSVGAMNSRLSGITSAMRNKVEADQDDVSSTSAQSDEPWSNMSSSF